MIADRVGYGRLGIGLARRRRRQLGTAHEMLSTMGVGAFADRAGRELLATGETVRKRRVETGGTPPLRRWRRPRPPTVHRRIELPPLGGRPGTGIMHCRRSARFLQRYDVNLQRA